MKGRGKRASLREVGRAFWSRARSTAWVGSAVCELSELLARLRSHLARCAGDDSSDVVDSEHYINDENSPLQ